ncbi:TetR/AcrR family transcriptional regulator [Acinetobacter sp. AYS6]|uniref:TetR/AcrR family transcriptional regulator n=1 Tax=unclassified Acinetobacter TaxID=196816 RepID=UPI0021D6571F|nr:MULTISPECIES: TetR/AcrR family transcriptional regulator [unclassified Acinetobacter]MCU7697601.1 TetR/AcrR family transcriptional regulator [Acinetobacter sp. AYS6]MEB3863046.1 TetR/AcrR family transcriptional regulator [Acinetobacter sp. IK31]
MTTQRRRPKHDPKESEREILNAAEKFLSEHPFRELNVDEVMKLTGLKRPAFYVHFRDKYDLALRVVEDISQELFTLANHWLKGNNFPEDSLQALEGIVNVYQKHGAVLRALSDAAVADARVEQIYRTLIQDFITATARHIYEEQEVGRITRDMNVEETARALVWLEERYLSEAFGRSTQSDPKVVVQVLHNIWLSTLYGTY